MNPLRLALLLALSSAFALPALAAGPKPTTNKDPRAFDGNWAVTLKCEEVQPGKGPSAKGYTQEFPVTVREGVLEGQLAKATEAGSVKFVGQISPDGKVQLQASGRTGNPEFSLGNILANTPFNFTMRGRFDATQGSAIRMELRPCKATFARR